MKTRDCSLLDHAVECLGLIGKGGKREKARVVEARAELAALRQEVLDLRIKLMKAQQEALGQEEGSR